MKRQPSTKQSKKRGSDSRRTCLVLWRSSSSARRSRDGKESHGRSLDGGVPDLVDEGRFDFGDHSDPGGGSDVEMAAEGAGEVEALDVTGCEPGVIEGDLQAGNVGPLGEGQFGDIFLGERDAAVRVDHEGGVRFLRNARGDSSARCGAVR